MRTAFAYARRPLVTRLDVVAKGLSNTTRIEFLCPTEKQMFDDYVSADTTPLFKSSSGKPTIIHLLSLIHI